MRIEQGGGLTRLPVHTAVTTYPDLALPKTSFSMKSGPRNGARPDKWLNRGHRRLKQDKLPAHIVCERADLVLSGAQAIASRSQDATISCKQGYSGDELVRQFEVQRSNIKRAVRNLLEEADRIADGSKPAATFHDIFGSDD